MGSPFEEGTALGRRLAQQGNFEAGVLYGYLAELRGVEAPPPGPLDADVMRVADGLAEAGVKPRIRAPTLLPAQKAVLAAVRNLRSEGPVLLRDVVDALAQTGRPMKRNSAREVLNGLVKLRLIDRKPSADRGTNRPAWSYEAMPLLKRS